MDSLGKTWGRWPLQKELRTQGAWSHYKGRRRQKPRARTEAPGCRTQPCVYPCVSQASPCLSSGLSLPVLSLELVLLLPLQAHDEKLLPGWPGRLRAAALESSPGPPPPGPATLGLNVEEPQSWALEPFQGLQRPQTPQPCPALPPA